MIGVIDIAGDCVQWTFPADPCAVATARARVRGQLGDWGVEAVADVGALLVSELVTNSLRYTAGPIVVRLARPPLRPGALLVEVSDPVPDLPSFRIPAADDENGRGLQLVAGQTSRWGARQAGTGKAVWFELSLPG
ncbi:ATP-binding protein [Streptomyces sulfonofaciens]|uniref:ATP-binding protein n=1 Tax=Streptomyces sulfonofaciens TaxID=68272 RepID=A0A919GBT1_9ACTN|nr:ATP-binding protein [Streptomyces sulfonofaciens]GHH81318.1 ATP-binding protein [Streptomyces sulfonofaciens]